MKSNFWFSKVLSKSTLTAMAALFMLSYGNVAYAAGPDMNIQAKQTKKVTGTVVDPSGEPMIGATVIEKGTSNGVVTDFDGNFAIDVPEGATIVISCIGFNSQEFPVAGKSTINATLQDDTESLDEIVVVGYGTMRKRDVTGSIAQTKGSDMVKAQNFSALDNLRGKASGVNIYSNSSQPGAYSSRVVIRGMSTINSSTDPLYVVDGVVMEDFGMVNPNDIETMEVLKDASAAAIYGARGANGVIIVTTKRGLSGEEGTRVSYDGSISLAQPARYMKDLNAKEWCDAFMKGVENGNKYYDLGLSTNRLDWFTNRDYFDANGNPIYDTDWQREATRTAISHNHQVSIQQAGKSSSMGAFLNYTDNQGIVNNTYSKRISGKMSYDANPTSWLSTSVNLLVNHTWGRYTPESGGGQEARRTMQEMLPWLPVYDKNGNYTTSNSPGAEMGSLFGFEGMSNPVMILDLQKRMNYNTQIFGNAALTFHILPGLDLKTQYGIDAHKRDYKGYSSISLNNISMPKGWAELAHTNTFYWQEETYLTYNKVLNDHRINAMAGLSWQERTYFYDRSWTEGFSDDFFEWNNMGAATNPSAPSSSHSSWRMNSYFLRLAYTFKDRYSVTATGRYDGSSKFGANHKYAFFPSAGLAWNISEEDFMKNQNVVSTLKLHTSYGITGNSEIGSFNSLAKVGSGTILMDGTRVPYAYLSSMPNDELRWEKTAQFDFGVNIGFFKNRLNFDISYYQKKTTDLLLDCPIPTTTGFGSIYKNIGSVKNQGVDFMMTATPVLTKDFNWDMTLNLNYNQNKVLHLGENDEDILLNGWVGGSESIIRVGENLCSFWGYERYGVYTDGGKYTQEDVDHNVCDKDKLGQPYEKNVIGRAKRSREKKIIGHGMPDWTGSFINTFRYKNFDATIDLQFVYGVETMQQFFHSTYDRFGFTNGLKDILYDAYDPAKGNDNTMQQMIYIANGKANVGQDTTIDSQWICDGSYLRANLIQVGYTFGKNACKKLGIEKARIYAGVNNAFLLCSKDFKGYDPESTSQIGDGRDQKVGQNMAFFSYPRARAFQLGVNVTFGGAHKAAKEVVYTAPETKYIEKVVEKVVEKPVVKEVTKEVYTGNGVHVVCFEVGKAELTAEAKAELDKVKGTADVVAYASPEGGADLNQTLSENRAKAVADYLASKGVKVNRTAGCGAPNAQSNRIAIVTVK